MTTPGGKGAIEYGVVHSVFVSVQGEGPSVGQLHLFVRFAGCDVGCEYCDTADSQSKSIPEATISYPACDVRQRNPLPAQLLADICRKLLNENPIQGISLTGGEPLLQASYAREVLRCLGTPCPPVMLETSALHPELLPTLLSLVQVVSADIKLRSTRVPKADEAKAIEFIRLASSKVKTWVKVPVDATVTTTELRRVLTMLAHAAPNVEVTIQPIEFDDRRRMLSSQELLKLFKVVLEVRPNARLIPQVHKYLGVK